MLRYHPRPDDFRFVLVFDSIDAQREAPLSLLPALARLHETVRIFLLSPLTSTSRNHPC